MTELIARRCHVSGRVQGVFYRASTRQRARELGVTGYARNLPDGRVEKQPLKFADTNTFELSLPLPPTGTSTLGVCAIQQAESNVGYAEIPIVVSG